MELQVDSEFPQVFGRGMIQFCLYSHPKDYPEGFVLRAWLIMPGSCAPLDWSKKSPTWSGIQVWREKLQARGLVPLMRNDADDPTIVESWI